MTIIAKPLPGYIGQEYSSAITMRDKQAWLRTMEQTGLAQALRNTQLMVAGMNKLSTARNEMVITAQTKGSAAVEYSIQHMSQEKQEALRDGLNLHARLPLQQYQSRENGMDFILSDDQSVTFLEENRAFEKSAISNVSSEINSKRSIQRWSLRNMVALQTLEGVEIWVRDAYLQEDAKIQQLLKDLQLQMESTGASLVRVVVNGNPVFLKQV